MSRPRFQLSLLPMIGGVLCIGSALAGGAWWLLPHWVPSLVCQHAPWVEPVARAAASDPGLEPFLLLRYHEWGPSADMGMVRCLSHRDPQVRKLVAEALFSQTPRQERLYPMLVELLAHTDTVVVEAAIACLGHSDHPQALTALIDHYWTCADDERSGRYLSAIEKAWRNEELPKVLAAVTQTTNPHDRRQALRILAYIHPAAAFDAVVTAMQQEPYPRVPLPDGSLHECAAYALCAKGGEERVIALLAHEDARLRVLAAAALLYMDHRRLGMAVDALRHAQLDPEVGVRAYALAALSEIAYPAHAEWCLQAMQSDEMPMRLAGLYPYRFDVQEPRAIPRLLELLQDPNPTIRPRVIEALCHQDDLRTIPALFACLPGESDKVRSRIARALGEKDATAVIDGFLDAFPALEPADRAFIVRETGLFQSQMSAQQSERLRHLRATVEQPVPASP